ncbi:cytochrome P450 [Streptomyces eurocidicus]|uniref:Sterol 14-demethylase n=2 Tax=Streptomyces eurocidicus TaxID=66423 RepID=A0A7W8BKM7_STREU|nr:cytochrome P450 [Streptomyces eurocidicus]MBB5123224.1 sterol 14-demethylase [Streptomyces eurocidicus]
MIGQRMAAAALPPPVSGGRPLVGHGVEFLRDGVRMLERGYREHGEAFTLLLGREPVPVLVGPEEARWFLHETGHSLSIGEGMDFLKKMFGPDFYLVAGPEEYQRQLPATMLPFRGRAAQQRAELMTRHAALFSARLGDRGTLELTSGFAELVLRTGVEAFLGPGILERLGPYALREFRAFARGLDPVTPAWLPAPHLLRAHRARDRLRTAAGTLVEERLRHPADPPDILQELVRLHAEQGIPARREQLANRVLSLALGSHNDTASSLAWALADLLRHPAELAAVRDEMGADPSRTAPVDPDTVRKLCHLHRAVQETMRLHPLPPVLVRRTLRDVEVAGWVLPRNHRVFITPLLTHRLPRLFDNPLSYRPGRYLADPKAAQNILTFGGGVHRCRGEQFAYLDIKITIAHLVRDFDLELLDTDPRPVRKMGRHCLQGPCRVAYRRRAV